MCLRWVVLSLIALAVSTAVRAQPVLTPPANSADERTLREIHLPITGAAVLDFFRQQTRTDVDPQRLQALIRQLDDGKAAVHVPAMAELVRVGIPAVAALRQAANSLDDPEAAQRAK